MQNLINIINFKINYFLIFLLNISYIPFKYIPNIRFILI